MLPTLCACPQSAAPKWGGFSFSKPSAEAEKPAEPAAPAPAKKEAPAAPAVKKEAPAAAAKKADDADMGNLFSSDMWNTPIKVRVWCVGVGV
jgi:hypothetical protein